MIWKIYRMHRCDGFGLLTSLLLALDARWFARKVRRSVKP